MEQALSLISRAQDAPALEVSAKDALLPPAVEGPVKDALISHAAEDAPAVEGPAEDALFSHAVEDASAVEGPAKAAAVHSANGIRTMELVDLITPTKLASTINDQLPPLLSMIIDGLPPLQQSKYVNEAEKRLHRYIERYPNVVSLGRYCRIGLSMGSYVHPGVISVDRLVVISLIYALTFMLDDLFFDTPDEFLQDQYGVSPEVCGSLEKIQEYLDHLDAVFGQQVQRSIPTPLIETMMWELGRDTLELSNLEWFNLFVPCVVECHRASVHSQADIVQGRNLYFQDLKSYTTMRIGNAGGRFVQMLVEFASNNYISGVLRANPYYEKLTMTTCIHIGFANDVFSYHKESMIEQNPRNLITVMMECEGEPFVQTVHMAIDLTNAYARAILNLEGEAWNLTLQNHLQDIKAILAGNVYFSIMDYRYRHPDSTFPELRDIASTWKIPPYSLV